MYLHIGLPDELHKNITVRAVVFSEAAFFVNMYRSEVVRKDLEKYPLEFRVYTAKKAPTLYSISPGGVFDSSRLVNLESIGAKYVINNLDSTDPAVDKMGILKAAEGDRIGITIYPATGYVLDQVNVKGIDNFTMGDLRWTKDDGGKDCWYYEFIMPAQDLTTEVLYKEYANELAEMLDP